MKISIRNLTKKYTTARGALHALGPIDLDVRAGEFVCIVGPSGCGKTTLLRVLAGLEVQTSGVATIAASDARGAQKPVQAMVFQGNWLFPWYTVAENVQYGPRLRGEARVMREKVSRDWLEMIGLSRFAEAYPHQLSEGMRQRVSLARALANDPEVLLMDEPFGALDEQTRLLLQQELLRIWEQSRKTVIFVTHSIDEAIVLGDRVLVMSTAPGRMIREEQIPFARPRAVMDLKAEPQFGALVKRIWDALGGEVMKARERELLP